MLLYYITDRSQFSGDETQRRRRLLDKIAEAARCGVDYVQLRERDLSSRQLEVLAREAVQAIAESKPKTENRERRTALLINSRSDVALAVGADGIHLRSDDLLPSEVKNIWRNRGAGAHETSKTDTPTRQGLVGVSCHSPDEVARAAQDGADFVVLAPVFEKHAADTKPIGIDSLRQACRHHIHVLALGGITLQNARQCKHAGAAGIAAIRLFQETDVEEVVSKLQGTG